MATTLPIPFLIPIAGPANNPDLRINFDSVTKAFEKLIAGVDFDGNNLTFDNFRGTFGANIAAGGFKITGLGAGSAAGNSVRYEQLKILQVVMGTSNTNLNTTSTTYVASNLSVNITPVSSSNKVLVFACGTAGMANPNNSKGRYTIFRGATDLDGSGVGFVTEDSSDTTAIGTSCAMFYLDSPATTSSTTYAVYLKADVSSNNVQFGRNGSLQVIIAAEVNGI